MHLYSAPQIITLTLLFHKWKEINKERKKAGSKLELKEEFKKGRKEIKACNNLTITGFYFLGCLLMDPLKAVLTRCVPFSGSSSCTSASPSTCGRWWRPAAPAWPADTRTSTGTCTEPTASSPAWPPCRPGTWRETRVSAGAAMGGAAMGGSLTCRRRRATTR